MQQPRQIARRANKFKARNLTVAPANHIFIRWVREPGVRDYSEKRVVAGCPTPSKRSPPAAGAYTTRTIAGLVP